MSFKIKRVGHLVLKVKDLERSRKFFTEVLGFPQVGENDRGMLFFSTDVVDNHHMLALREAQARRARCRTPSRSAWSMCRSNSAPLPNCRQLYRKFKEHNVKIRHDDFPRRRQKHLFLRSRRQPARSLLQRATG